MSRQLRGGRFDRNHPKVPAAADKILSGIPEKKPAFVHLYLYDEAKKGVPPRIDLSGRSKQVLTLLRAGLAEKQIARRLGLSLNTVHDYVKRIYLEYDVPSRADLLALWASEEAWEMREDDPPRDGSHSVADELERATRYLNRAYQAAQKDGVPESVRDDIDAVKTLLQSMVERTREQS